MTVNDIISYVDRVYRNDIDNSVKVELVAQCDEQLRLDLLSTHEPEKNCEKDARQDTAEYDGDTVLFAPDRYADLYRWYLQARLSLLLNEAGTYQACATLYESIRDEYAKEYNRTHMPRGRVEVLKLI